MPLRKFEGDKLLIASHNPGKSAELIELIKTLPNPPATPMAGDLGLPVPTENGSTFIENAKIKAIFCAKESGLPAIADDSGIAVSALNGQPGIYSARWAGNSDKFDSAMQRILDEVGSSKDRTATFHCALAIAWPDGYSDMVEGKIKGTLADVPVGEHGFGYDPLFIPRSYKMTFGQMDPRDKKAISHRADAWRKLLARAII